MTDLVTSRPPYWVRSPDGLVAGVCDGLAKKLGVDPWIVRGLWLVAVLAFGTGLVAYVIFAFCLPRSDRLQDAEQKKIFGVCLWISRNTGVEVGIVRAVAVFLALASFGASIVVYLILALIASNDRGEQGSTTL